MLTTAGNIVVHGTSAGQLRVLRADTGEILKSIEVGTGIMAAYVVNELTDAARGVLLDRLLTAAAANARVLIIEPIARRMVPWWTAWRGAFEAAGGRADEWRLEAPLPERQRDLARAAGLDPRTLAARSLLL